VSLEDEFLVVLILQDEIKQKHDTFLKYLVHHLREFALFGISVFPLAENIAICIENQLLKNAFDQFLEAQVTENLLAVVDVHHVDRK
jgi:hypothetical protein